MVKEKTLIWERCEEGLLGCVGKSVFSCIIKGDKTGLLFSAKRLRGHIIYLYLCLFLNMEKGRILFKDSVGKRVSQCKLTDNKL